MFLEREGVLPTLELGHASARVCVRGPTCIFVDMSFISFISIAQHDF